MPCTGIYTGEIRMGWNDHLPDEGEFAAIAIQAGALRVCPIHPDVTIDQRDPEATNRAYAIPTNKWTAGELFVDREDIAAGIKLVIDHAAANECPRCADLRDAE